MEGYNRQELTDLLKDIMVIAILLRLSCRMEVAPILIKRLKDMIEDMPESVTRHTLARELMKLIDIYEVNGKYQRYTLNQREKAIAEFGHDFFRYCEGVEDLLSDINLDMLPVRVPESCQ